MERVPKMARGKISLAHGIHCCPIFLFFGSFSPSILLIICVHIHISDCVETVYELPLLPNNTAGEIILPKSGAVRRVVWIFIIGATAWR